MAGGGSQAAKTCAAHSLPSNANLGVAKASNATANEIILTAVCSSMTEN
jgi:hypothetical protein